MSFGWETLVLKNQNGIIHKTFPAEVSEPDDVLLFISELAERAGAGLAL